MPAIFLNIYPGDRANNDFLNQSTNNNIGSIPAKGVGMPALTNVPLPAWRDLGAAMLGRTQPDTVLSAPWLRSGDTGFWLSRSAWSLLVIAQCRQRTEERTSITVWVPDFFCNGALAPLRNIGVQLQFYPLTDQMDPDLDACRIMSEKSRPDLFLLVHYFGRPSPAEEAVVFCREKNAWLIEDAAHVLRPIAGIGAFGDFVLYSPYKHLPIPDGAVLVVRETGPARLINQAQTMEILRDIYSALINSPRGFDLSVSLWLFKRVLQRIGIRNLRRPVFPFFQDDDTTDTALQHPRLSSLAKRLLSGLLDSLDSVASARTKNSLTWEDILAKSGVLKSTNASIAADFTPYLLGVIFHDEKVAEKAFLRCQNRGLPVTTWPDLPPEIMTHKAHHHNALLFRNTRVYLQVHQPLTYLQVMDCIGSLQYEMNNV